MIRTRFTLEELERISKFPDCPCLPNPCKDTAGHWEMWQRAPNRDYYWLATDCFTDEFSIVYRYKEHLFEMIWNTENYDENVGQVYRYMKSVKGARACLMTSRIGLNGTRKYTHRL